MRCMSGDSAQNFIEQFLQHKDLILSMTQELEGLLLMLSRASLS